LGDFRSVTGVYDHGRDRVPEGVKPATRNVECVEHRPQVVFDDFV
jgi:hypothetical protein